MARRRGETWQTVSVRPLTGVLDTRSEVEDVPLGAWRFKQNWQLRGGNKLCVRPNFDRAFASFVNGSLIPPAYSNFDLHDQFDVPSTAGREFITLLFSALDNTGNTTLYAGSQSWIKYLNISTGYWQTVITNLGGPPEPSLPQTRFRMSLLQNELVFTNNVDSPMHTTIGSNAASTIPDLVTMQVTKAGVTVSWNGFIFLMDLVEGGKRISSRIRWSSINCPLSWQDAPGTMDCSGNATLAGFQDLDYGERILNAIPMAGSLYVFTTQAIWVIFVNNSTQSGSPTFSFAKVYSEPLNQNKCLAYPNTLVSAGNSCWYCGSDGIYFFSPYIPEPERTEWLYRGSAMVFNDNLTALDPSCCQSPVMILHPDTTEIWLSWPQAAANGDGGCVNSSTFIFDYQYKSPDVLDYGFSAFVNFRPSTADPEACQSAQLFLGAGCPDLCLKEIGNVFSRAICTNAATGKGTTVDGKYIPFTGQYSYEGYYRILRALLPLQNYDREKFIRNFLLECTPSDSSSNNVVHLRIGTSESEADPNLPDGVCSVLWYPQPDKPLACNSTQTSPQLAAALLKPIPPFEWPMLQSGRFIYFEITIQATDGSPAIGGDCCLSRIETQIRIATAGIS
jgi:hypothetical protein